MDKIKTYLTHPTIKNILFWIGMFSYYVLIANMDLYSGYRQLFESYGLIVGVQMVTAFICLKFLIPQFLNKDKTVQFVLWLLVILYFLFGFYIAFKINYFDIKYIDSYNDISKAYAQKTFLYRWTHWSVFFSKCILYLTPTVLLLFARFYRNQKEYLQLSEQKKVAELSALKNQLNPHFFVQDEIHTIKYSITSFLELLDHRFLRTHRSYIVNVDKITAYTKHDIEIGKIEIPIGESYRQAVQNHFQK